MVADPYSHPFLFLSCHGVCVRTIQCAISESQVCDGEVAVTLTLAHTCVLRQDLVTLAWASRRPGSLFPARPIFLPRQMGPDAAAATTGWDTNQANWGTVRNPAGKPCGIKHREGGHADDGPPDRQTSVWALGSCDPPPKPPCHLLRGAVPGCTRLVCVPGASGFPGTGNSLHASLMPNELVR